MFGPTDSFHMRTEGESAAQHSALIKGEGQWKVSFTFCSPTA